MKINKKARWFLWALAEKAAPTPGVVYAVHPRMPRSTIAAVASTVKTRRDGKRFILRLQARLRKTQRTDGKQPAEFSSHR